MEKGEKGSQKNKGKKESTHLEKTSEGEQKKYKRGKIFKGGKPSHPPRKPPDGPHVETPMREKDQERQAGPGRGGGEDREKKSLPFLSQQ